MFRFVREHIGYEEIKPLRRYDPYTDVSHFNEVEPQRQLKIREEIKARVLQYPVLELGIIRKKENKDE